MSAVSLLGIRRRNRKPGRERATPATEPEAFDAHFTAALTWVLSRTIDHSRKTHHRTDCAQLAGRRSTTGSILRATSRPSLSVPDNWPFSTMTLPRRIVVVGHPSTDQPSHGL